MPCSLHPPSQVIICPGANLIEAAKQQSFAQRAAASHPCSRCPPPSCSPPLPSHPKVVICPGANLTDAAKRQCYAQLAAARSSCNGTCAFAYAAAQTPTILSVNPSISRGGETITISGYNIVDVAQVGLYGMSVF